MKSKQQKSSTKHINKSHKSTSPHHRSKRSIKTHSKSHSSTSHSQSTPYTTSIASISSLSTSSSQPSISSISPLQSLLAPSSPLTSPLRSKLTTPHHKLRHPFKLHKSPFSSYSNPFDDSLQIIGNGPNPAFNPLATQIGHEHYNFEPKTSLGSAYQPNPQDSPEQIDNTSFPADADAEDIFTALQKQQQRELERDLEGIFDDHQRSLIIYNSAVTLQHRLSQAHKLRRNQSIAAADQCRHALTQMRAHRSQMSVLDVLSLLRAVSIDDANIQVYSLQPVSDLHSFMVFFTARDQKHTSLVAETVRRYVESHPKFLAKPSESGSKRSSVLRTAGADIEEKSLDVDAKGKKRGELLVFSKSDLQWRMLDLGSVLLHVSYGSERTFTDIESVLKPYHIDTNSPANTKALSEMSLSKCLEITPVSQLDE